MEAHKNIPELRFPGFEGEWDNMLLGDILTFKNGINAAKEDYGFGHKFINVLDIINNDFITNEKIIGSVNISDADFQKNIVEYGDILFQRSSETREEVGQANVYLDKNKPATFGGFVIRGKKKAEYNPLFLNYLLKTQKARNEITTKSGGSTRYNIGQETLSAVGVFMSNLNEQQKIASFLSSIDQRIQLLTHKKEQLEQYKKGVMQQIFSRQLRFKDDQGKEYPEWEEKRLSTICEKRSSNISAINLTENKGIYKIYGATGHIQNVDFYLEKEPYISIVKDGAGVGRVLICENNSSVLGTLDIIKPKEGFDIFFLFTVLSLISFNKYITGSTIPHIYFKDYSKEFINVPTLREQQKIASFLSSIDDKITRVNTKIEQTRKWKQGLLQKMFV